MDKLLRSLEHVEITLQNTLRDVDNNEVEKIVLETIMHNLRAVSTRIRKRYRKESKGEIKKCLD